MIESKSGKTRISAPAQPSATGGRVSGLVPSIFDSDGELLVAFHFDGPLVGPSVRRCIGWLVH